MLTPKQQTFCRCIALEGMGQSDAYRIAYNTKNMNSNTINNNAYKLTRNNDIATMINKLRATLEEKVVEKQLYTAKESFNKLNELQELAVKDSNINSALKAEELKGKLACLYVDQTKISGDKDAPIQADININFITPKDNS